MKKYSISMVFALFCLFSSTLANSQSIFETNPPEKTSNYSFSDNFLPLVNPPKGNVIKFRYGILGGVSYYLVNKDELITLSNTNNVPEYHLSVDKAELGLHFGVFSQLFLGPVFIRPEITFNSNVINYKLDDLANVSASKIVSERYQHLDIPILLGFKTGGVRINAGPVGHVFISNKSDLVDIANFSTEFKRMTLGYQAGVGIDIYNFMIDLRYEGNFIKLGDGIIFGGERIYFSRSPGRLIATLTFAIK